MDGMPYIGRNLSLAVALQIGHPFVSTPAHQTRIPFLCLIAGLFLMPLNSFGNETDATVATAPVPSPNVKQAGKELPDGVITWEQRVVSAEAAANQEEIHVTFKFKVDASDSVTIRNVQSSCGCTTIQLPATPWLLKAGTLAALPVRVNLAGKTGTLVKTVNVITDKGDKTLTMRITILPAPIHMRTDAERARNMIAAKADRQAVFKNDCASCHVEPGRGKYGKELFEAVCAICHADGRRASMVPDLSQLKSPTNEDYWKHWISKGKTGSLMPAFSTAEGGPLNEMQIATLVAYLNGTHASKEAAPNHE